MRSALSTAIACLFAGLAVLSNQTSAATLAVASSGPIPVIMIQGQLDAGDEQRFVDLALNRPNAIVMFDSPGGLINVGIEIGKAIRLKGFVTAVPNGAVCASACALAWLGGRKRLLSASGKLGFHAAYLKNADGTTISSSGNALVGAYFNQLGLSSAAIEYLTSAPPEGMNWISAEDARRFDVEVVPLELGPSPKAPEAPAAPPTPSTPATSIMPEPTTPTAKVDWANQGDWVQTASRPSLSAAEAIAQIISEKNPNTSVFQYRNGWYAVVLGPFAPGRGEVARAALVAANEVPSDSLVTHGENFAALAWGSPRPRQNFTGADNSVPVATKNAVALVQRYYGTWSGNNETALSFLQTTYDDSIIYYGKASPRSAVLQEKTNFATRWPQRTYNVEDGSLSTTCDSVDTQTCAVSGVVSWDVQAPERNARSTGKARFVLRIRSLASTPRIIDESAVVLSRAKSAIEQTYGTR